MLEGFIQSLETRPLVLEEFDEKLWAVAVEKIKVKPDGSLAFYFKDGAGIKAYVFCYCERKLIQSTDSNVLKKENGKGFRNIIKNHGCRVEQTWMNY